MAGSKYKKGSRTNKVRPPVASRSFGAKRNLPKGKAKEKTPTVQQSQRRSQTMGMRVQSNKAQHSARTGATMKRVNKRKK